VGREQGGEARDVRGRHRGAGEPPVVAVDDVGLPFQVCGNRREHGGPRRGDLDLRAAGRRGVDRVVALGVADGEGVREGRRVADAVVGVVVVRVLVADLAVVARRTDEHDVVLAHRVRERVLDDRRGVGAAEAGVDDVVPLVGGPPDRVCGVRRRGQRDPLVAVLEPLEHVRDVDRRLGRDARDPVDVDRRVRVVVERSVDCGRRPSDVRAVILIVVPDGVAVDRRELPLGLDAVAVGERAPDAHVGAETLVLRIAPCVDDDDVRAVAGVPVGVRGVGADPLDTPGVPAVAGRLRIR